MGLSVHLTSHEQFNPNQVINLASYFPPGNFMDTSDIDFFSLTLLRSFISFSNFKNISSCLRVMSKENFRLLKCFSKLSAMVPCKLFWSPFEDYRKLFQRTFGQMTENCSP